MIPRVASRIVRATRYSRVENPGQRTRSSFKRNARTATHLPGTNAGQLPARYSETTSELARRSRALPASGGSAVTVPSIILARFVSNNHLDANRVRGADSQPPLASTCSVGIWGLQTLAAEAAVAGKDLHELIELLLPIGWLARHQRLADTSFDVRAQYQFSRLS